MTGNAGWRESGPDDELSLAMDRLLDALHPDGADSEAYDEALWTLVVNGLRRQGVPEERMSLDRLHTAVSTLLQEGNDEGAVRLEVVPSPLIGSPFVLTNDSEPYELTQSSLFNAYASMLRVSLGSTGTLLVDARILTADEALQWWVLREDLDRPGLWSIEAEGERMVDLLGPTPWPCTALSIVLPKIAQCVTGRGN